MAAPILGDLLYRAALVWTRLAGNTTATKKFLTQTGTGAASAAPGWNTIASGDLPSGTVTTSATLTAGKTIIGAGTSVIDVSALTATVAKSSSGTLSAASAGTDYVAPGAITTDGITMSTARLLGRTTAATGAVEEISVGTGLTLSGGTLTGSGGTVHVDAAGALTGDGSIGTPLAVVVDGVTVQIIADQLTATGTTTTPSFPIEVTSNTTLPATRGWVIPESLEIDGGVILTIDGGARAEITGPVTPPGLVQIGSPIVSVGQATIDFTSIPATYTHLKVIYTAQDTQTGTSSVSLRVRLNNDSTAADYTATSRIGSSNGSSVATTLAASTGGVTVGLNPQSGNTGIAATGELTIASYAGTTFHKRVLATTAVDDGTSNGTVFTAEARWKSTAAVSRLTFTTDGTAFTAGSVFTLYGLT